MLGRSAGAGASGSTAELRFDVQICHDDGAVVGLVRLTAVELPDAASLGVIGRAADNKETTSCEAATSRKQAEIPSRGLGNAPRLRNTSEKRLTLRAGISLSMHQSSLIWSCARVHASCCSRRLACQLPEARISGHESAWHGWLATKTTIDGYNHT